ncbi:hypothetical protein PInf_009173 [Phytophthora infestans]|nr:hypothetical protein PInf_009173 [Phytophthora infestans]
MKVGTCERRAGLRYHKPVDYVRAAQGFTTDPVDDDDDMYIDDPLATLADVVNEDADMEGLVNEDEVYDAGADGESASADAADGNATYGDTADGEAASADDADGDAASADVTADADVATETANADGMRFASL